MCSPLCPRAACSLVLHNKIVRFSISCSGHVFYILLVENNASRALLCRRRVAA